MYLLLYVDDMLLVSSSPKWISDIKTSLNGEFDMKDLGNAKRILGMEIERDMSNSILFLHQSSYVSKALKKFGMYDCKPVTLPLTNHFVLSKDQAPCNEKEIEYMSRIPYFNVIGSIMYMMVCARPDLAFTINNFSIYMSNPGPEHWKALKWLLRYLKRTCNVGLRFVINNEGVKMKGFIDADYKYDGSWTKTISGTKCTNQ